MKLYKRKSVNDPTPLGQADPYMIKANGKYYVYKKSGLAGKELAEVEIGLKNESYVEILSGLSPEDTIYVATSVSGAN